MRVREATVELPLKRRSEEVGRLRSRRRIRRGGMLLSAVLGLAAFGGCRDVPLLTTPTATHDDCLARAVFGDPTASGYCMPFPAGTELSLSQSYCSDSGWSHHNRIALDFECQIGDEIVAARGGTVEIAGDEWPDDDPTGGHENRVVIRHEDGTVAFYAHFERGGVAVDAGDVVSTGQTLGRCGMSGTTGPPHLHFEVFERAAYEWDRTVPVSFRNLEGALDSRGGLQTGTPYRVLQCG